MWIIKCIAFVHWSEDPETEVKALCIPIVGTTENKDQRALLNYPTNISGVDAVDSVSGGEECGIDRVIL